MIELDKYGWRVAAAPENGGALISASYKGVDVLRPTPPAALRSGDPLEMASFPLLPFSNRIRDGRFSFRSTEVSLPASTQHPPHALHGYGWSRRWYPEVTNATECIMILEYPGDDWPWRFRAEQRIRISESSLSLSLSVRNEAATAMPLGLGFHPYFPRSPGCRIQAPVDGRWVSDAERLPVSHEIVSGEMSLRTPTVLNGLDLDHCFTGWDGDAIIAWPEKGLSLRLTASKLLRFLVLWTPEGTDFFCVEPVSHMIDAFNWCHTAHDTGTIALEPGRSAEAAMVLEPLLPQEQAGVPGH